MSKRLLKRRAAAPSSPEGYVGLNYVLGYIGEAEEAARAIAFAMRLDPHYPPEYLARLAFAHLNLEEYEAAATLLKRTIEQSPDNYLFYVTLNAALGHLDRRAEAERTIQAMQATRARLGMTPVMLYYLNLWPYKHQADRARMRTGLEKAGLRDY